MKSYKLPLLFMLFVSFLMTSCSSNENDSSKEEKKPELLGIWKITGFDYAPDPSYGLIDMGKFYIFNENNYQFTVNPDNPGTAYPCSYDWGSNEVKVKSSYGDYIMTFEIKNEELFLSFDMNGSPCTYRMKRASEEDLKKAKETVTDKKMIPYYVGDVVDIMWKGKWYPGKVIEVVEKDRYKVHYDGYGSEYDEVVTPERLILIKGI